MVKIISEIRNGSLIVVCIQEKSDKVQFHNTAIDFEKKRKRLADKDYKYVFEDKKSGHKSETNYIMIIVEK
jgi:hypothetical protein